jgi:hypothetical protein
MNTHLYQVKKLKVFGIEPGKAGEYGHTFGGPAQHEGIIPKGGKQPLHLTYCLNTADPKVGIKISGVRWLPLYNGFVYESCGLGYRVVSDTEIEILHMESLNILVDFPYEKYPSVFRKVSVNLCEMAFDPKNLEHAITFSGIFGFDRVPKRERAKMYSLLAETYREINLYGDDEPPGTFEELARWFEFPFMQGRPDSKCPNRKCPNHAVKGKMHVLAIVGNKPAPRVSLWGKLAEEMLLIFEICPKCKAIYTSGQCT